VSAPAGERGAAAIELVGLQKTYSLTHVNRGLRTVMLEPGTLVDVALPLGLLAAFAAACFVLALRLFRWQ
jgi:hypothetical protein